MDLRCHVCGKRFRTMNAEAYHRHNWPALCRRNRQFERFMRELDRQAAIEKRAALQVSKAAP